MAEQLTRRGLQGPTRYVTLPELQPVTLTAPTLGPGVTSVAEGSVASLIPGGLIDLGIAIKMTTTKSAGTTLLTVPTEAFPLARVRIPLAYHPGGAAPTATVWAYLETTGTLACYSGLGNTDEVLGHITYRGTT